MFFNKKFFSIRFFSVFSCFMLAVVQLSCSTAQESSLALQTPKHSAPLAALNKNAVEARIIDAKKSPYMYFAFSQTIMDEQLALQVLVQSSAETEGNYALGFLTTDDFSKDTVLKKQLSDRPLVKISTAENSFVLSFEMPTGQAVKGFFLYAPQGSSIKTASLVAPQYGWQLIEKTAWYGFDSQGGTAPKNIAAMQSETTVADFTKKTELRVDILLNSAANIGSPEKQERLDLQVGTDRVGIRLAPHQDTISLYSRIIGGFTNNQKIVLLDNPQNTQNSQLVRGIVCISAENMMENTDGQLLPLAADPGLVPTWPLQAWRRADFELFRWQQFSSVLIFDTADYAIQDAFFKRLAFYVEKSGYVGTLVSDAILAPLHGFNAHDYRAESLAAFFNQAEREKFALNKYELLLRDILFNQKIILKAQDGTIVPGSGAVISISQESPLYLRYTFITHEALHGIFFVDQDYRDAIEKIFNQTDPKSREFLLSYFTATPSLLYDPNDHYLIVNEFMAYTAQQPVFRISDYFVKNIAARKGINAVRPDLVAYIIETNAEGFVQAGQKINDYLFSRWGYAAGRVALVSRNAIR